MVGWFAECSRRRIYSRLEMKEAPCTTQQTNNSTIPQASTNLAPSCTEKANTYFTIINNKTLETHLLPASNSKNPSLPSITLLLTCKTLNTLSFKPNLSFLLQLTTIPIHQPYLLTHPPWLPNNS